MVAEVDAIGRRSRFRPTSTGKRVRPTERDFTWFAKLAEHGPLPSAYLHAFTADLRRNEKRARERLTDLFNESETPHGDAYLSRPLQQFQTIDSRYNHLVYDLTPASRKALHEVDRLPAKVPQSGGPWLHHLMVACITASIELETRVRDDLKYIPGSLILERANTDLRSTVSYRDPATDSVVDAALVPDAVFGLEYRTNEGSRFRFFVLEADRSTEPIASSARRKSWIRSLAQYQAYIGEGQYRKHLALSAPLLLMLVSPSTDRIDALMKAAQRSWGARPWLLFKAVPAFAIPVRMPPPLPQLLSEPWQRIDTAAFNLSDP